MTYKVVFIANDFGFGPTSHALSIAKGLSQRGATVRLVTAQKNDAILANSGVDIDHITNLRSIEDITAYLNQIDPETVLVSVMNRFAVEVAKSINKAVILVDDLFWFWSEANRPAEYSKADLQIRCVLPWQLDTASSSERIKYASVRVGARLAGSCHGVSFHE